MIWEGPRGPQCMGFASFLDYLNGGPNGGPDSLICALKADVEALAVHFEQAMPRLTELQHSLIDLVVFLDPGAIRFPEKNRIKIDLKS
jgi:hypothetical protein